LHYLKGTTTHGLHITRSYSFALYGFTDADWAGSVNDRKSTGGYLVFFGQTLILWKSGKQRTVARSSTKAECKVLADGTAEVIWLKYLLTDLQISSIFTPIIWCDNLSTTYLSTNLVFMLAQNMLRLIIILSKIELRRRRFRFVLFPLRINLLMSLLSHFLLLRLLLFVSSFGLILHPQLERAY
jgi:hypothetical protein